VKQDVNVSQKLCTCNYRMSPYKSHVSSYNDSSNQNVLCSHHVVIFYLPARTYPTNNAHFSKVLSPHKTSLHSTVPVMHASQKFVMPLYWCCCHQ